MADTSEMERGRDSGMPLGSAFLIGAYQEAPQSV